MTRAKSGGRDALSMVNPNAAAIDIGSTMHKGAAAMRLRRSRPTSDREKVIPLRIRSESHGSKPLGIPQWTLSSRSIH